MQKNEFVLNASGLKEKAIQNTIQLLDGGATIPFISRYRKEMTGGLDEVQVAQIRDLAKKYEELISRQQTIIGSIEEQGKLTDELKTKVLTCFDSIVLEDIYLPYKQKRQTKGDKAKKLGLEPLARMIMSQRGGDPEQMAERFLKGDVVDEDMAIQGAVDIMAEWINENAIARGRVRTLFQRKAIFASKLVKGKEEEGAKYRDYFDFSEPLYKVASHRFLAIIRAEREGVLSLKAQPEKDDALESLERFFVKTEDECGDLVAKACKESYSRLMCSSLENELLAQAKEKADKEAISVFSTNLRQLLLAPPVGNKRTLAIDPGFRTGCKVVCLDEHGNLLTNVTIFPHAPQNEKDKASSKIFQLVQAYKIEAIAIGDGTAGRETEAFIKHVRFDRDLDVYVVREDGASIYSASPIARKEFPDYDVTVRGAVSIGRRLMDPLAELVKIDAKSVGVGQYQHEVNQTSLKDALDDVVVSAVNAVGVDLNTASPYLLSYVSGLGLGLAENIVAYRTENGGIKSREELKKVKRLGDKAYEQAAGFLRVRDGENPLDNSSVHPESYKFVKQVAKKLGIELKDLIGNETKLNEVKHADFSEIDSFTFTDIIKELKKPGRDPRKKAQVLEFDSRIRTISDLKEGMILTGIVTNVTNFGAFVNIGIKENGLIHKSQLADVYVEDPTQFISLHEHVEVRVMEIDEARKRVGLQRLS
ncbi:Tex family protein [Fluviicola taffensis]|uniref:Tex-like protein n=1 Tax=Fluviicola taffensis (strain DSM 16823 / NCIMB 13979 / RW262) TaxID=755732 RepID=F2IC94_FLUTR|nr:Tex family protein [Fluviicola taffensis]AEA44340.1 Tex-like protein [Fluviicola taffensis DSM 16823]